jgi:polysaccharide export outer membrane protein
MKKWLYIFTVALVVLFSLAACNSAKNVAYIQGAGEGDMFGHLQETPLYDAHIMPKDLLTITVSATDPEAVKPFNLTVPSLTTGITTYSQPALQTYLVDNNGQINFPVMGMITLGGLTKRQAEEKITGLLNKYLKEQPVVTVRFVNYKISVLGEVARPNTFTIVNEKVNLFEALAMAGDMTIWGRRDNVKIIREDANGNQSVVVVNLNDPGIIYSPYYFLQQNDVLYVEPNKTKARNSDIGSATGIWLSATSILISVATLLINVLK